MKMDRRLFHAFSAILLLLLLQSSLIAAAASTAPAETAEVVERKPYIIYMGERLRNIVEMIASHASILDKAVKLISTDGRIREHIIHSYTRSFSGFAAMLTEEEAKKLSSMDGVVTVFESRTRMLHTTRSWDFLGLASNVTPAAALESDVIIGMIDTGIWPESESFGDAGFGPPPSKWKGACQGNNNFTCNNKVIGARHYHLNGAIDKREIPSPRDSNGHGSHTASIAAGRIAANVSLVGIAGGTARGGVPSARLAVYKACWTSGCSDVDVLAAFDDAIADGVDIISISMGVDSAKSYFEDSVAIGSFHAMKKGILTSASAGNTGPSKFTVENYAPWMLTVAASTIDRNIVAQTKTGNDDTYQGIAINTFESTDKQYPLIYGGDAPNKSSGAIGSFSRFCSPGSLDGDLVKGKIVVCDDNTQGLGLSLAGSVGAIMQTLEPDGDSFYYKLPVSVLLASDIAKIKQYINKTSNPTASILKSRDVFDAAAPYAASFSSRGPNPVTRDILKPDLAAPGVKILAAWSPVSKEKPGVLYNILSGTSMACPHVTGAAAYIKSFNPTWSPAAIKSALITTADEMKPSKNKEAELAYGAGHLNPVASLKPGLVYDADETDYIKMLCGQGYQTEELRRVTGDTSSCTASNNGTIYDINYPSFSLSVEKGKPFSATFQRTVTNVGESSSTYNASVSAPTGLKISVEPSVLSFGALIEKKTFSLKVEGGGIENVVSSALVWSDGKHHVRSPIVVHTSTP